MVTRFSFSAAPCILQTHSMVSCTLFEVFQARKLKSSFSPSCVHVKAIPCRLVYVLILLSRMHSAMFENVKQFFFTFARGPSFLLDERDHLCSADLQMVVFFALFAFMQVLVFGEPIFLRSGWFSLWNTSLSNFQIYL